MDGQQDGLNGWMFGLTEWWTTWRLITDVLCITRGYPGTWPAWHLYQWHDESAVHHLLQVCRWLQAPLNMFEGRAAIWQSLDNQRNVPTESLQNSARTNAKSCPWKAIAPLSDRLECLPGDQLCRKGPEGTGGHQRSLSQQWPWQQWGPMASWAISTRAWPVDGQKGIPLSTCTCHI